MRLRRWRHTAKEMNFLFTGHEYSKVTIHEELSSMKITQKCSFYCARWAHVCLFVSVCGKNERRKREKIHFLKRFQSMNERTTITRCCCVGSLSNQITVCFLSFVNFYSLNIFICFVSLWRWNRRRWTHQRKFVDFLFYFWWFNFVKMFSVLEFGSFDIRVKVINFLIARTQILIAETKREEKIILEREMESFLFICSAIKSKTFQIWQNSTGRDVK